MDLENLWAVVRSIPEGKVASYGDVGAALDHPATGRMVGRWMANCPRDVPWWRVVDRNGRFPIGRRDPYLEKQQKDLLIEEGVQVDGDCVSMPDCRFVP